MRIASLLFLCVIWLSSCTKHPSTLAGVWKTGDQGLFTAQVVLTLNPDGTGKLNAGTTIAGFPSADAKWEFTDGKLRFTEASGAISTFSVVSKSQTTLVLKVPENGALLNFERISDR